VSDRAPLDPRRMVYRWDLDKTYLRTEFDTVRDLLRTAFEKAREKRTVPGAAELLRGLAATEPAAISILSGSPEQMRRVLEAKLRLDGVRWDSFTLKPSLRNLARGRLRFVKDQVAYKLAALLEARVTVAPDTEEVLFGDDAEADAFVYSLYADLAAGRVGNQTLMEVLRRARVYERDLPMLVRLAGRLPRRDHVRRIFIHLDRGSAPQVFSEFGRRVCPFQNYLQPALVLLEDGVLDADAALRVGVELVLDRAMSPGVLGASFLDLVRRGYVGTRCAAPLLAALESSPSRGLSGVEPALVELESTLRDALGKLDEPAATEPPTIDYVALFSRDKARARAARARARYRVPR